MNNFHYHQDPLYSAAARILEGVSDVEAIVAEFSVGDNTNFGKVLEIGSDSITFKAKDLPKTKISFKQRKMGSSEFLLTKLIKLKEETASSEETLDEAYKPLRKPEALVDELQSIIDAPDAKLWDVTSVSIRLSHDDIFDRFPKIYPFVKDMWAAIMTPDGARKTKEIAKKAIEAVHKYYPIKEETEGSEESLQEETSLSTLRQRLNTHAEAASDANRKGDDEKVKYHQTQINKIKERMAAMVRNESLQEDAKADALDNQIERLMKQRTELEAEDDDLQRYISNAIERDEARGNDPDENNSIASAKKELSDLQDKHAKVDAEIQKLRAERKKLSEEVETLDEASNNEIFSAGSDAGYSTSEVSKLLQQALKHFNNSTKAKEALVYTFNSVKNSKKDFSKFSSDFASLYNAVHEEVETLEEAINWLGDYLTTSEKSQFGGYRPTIIDKKTKRVIYQGAAKYNKPEEAKDHAEDYLKQKSKGIRDPKVPVVGTYKEEIEGEDIDEESEIDKLLERLKKYPMRMRVAQAEGNSEMVKFYQDQKKKVEARIAELRSKKINEEVTEAVDPATKRRKQLDMARVNAGAMSRDDYNKKYKLGKYRPAGSKPGGPGGLYKNLVKEVLNPDDDASVWIDDFVKSDDPRFDGKSKEERIKMALGAWYAAQKKESVETTEDTLEEATMNAAEKKMAQEIHKVFKDGEQVSQAYALRIRDMRKQLIKKFGNNWRQKAGITEESVDSLEEAVPLPTVQKIIAKIDEMSPKEYSNFLHALADNALGISLNSVRVKVGGPSNAGAWETVAKRIHDAAVAYDARPVKMEENVEEAPQTLEEGLYPLTKKALDATFNLDPDELEEFLKELAKNLNNEGDDTGFDDWYTVAGHIEKAYKAWKIRDKDI